MSALIKTITVDDIYVSILSERRELDAEGNGKWVPVVKQFPPTGSVIMDALGRVLMQTRYWEAAEIAAQLEVDVRDLGGAMRILTGTQTKDFVAAYRLRQAQEWLRCTDLDLLEIARRCGQQFSETLINRFRRDLKTTPITYRRKHRPENFRELYRWK